jgi:hypothetical protein
MLSIDSESLSDDWQVLQLPDDAQVQYYRTLDVVLVRRRRSLQQKLMERAAVIADYTL